MSTSHAISTDVLIIGAGPYGLALAARLEHLGVAYCIVGESMGFWRHNMPAGMFLRSSWDWPLDPQGCYTIERFLQESGISKADVSPFPLATYLDYAEWFRDRSGVLPLDLRVERLDREPDGTFVAHGGEGTRIHANSVVLAIGYSGFPHVPRELADLLPEERVSHTLDFVELSRARDRSILLIGGRQSAFEWAALLVEAGAREVHVSHRHPSPQIIESDWTWVWPLMQGIIQNPGWFRELPESDREAYRRRLWGEGRLKVEPWLGPRLQDQPVSIWPETRVTRCSNHQNGTVTVELANGPTIAVDDIVLATGYKANVARVDFLRGTNVVDLIETIDGLPVLDTHFQSSVPGLYITSVLATRDFGPFMRFTVAAAAAATVLGDELGRAKGKRRPA